MHRLAILQSDDLQTFSQKFDQSRFSQRHIVDHMLVHPLREYHRHIFNNQSCIIKGQNLMRFECNFFKRTTCCCTDIQ